MKVSIAVVSETSLGDSGRAILVKNRLNSTSKRLVHPLLEGLFKMPPPEVDDLVAVFTIDAENAHRYYMPIRAEFSDLSDDSTKAQLESAGEVEIKAGPRLYLDGDTIELGSSSLEAAVKGDTIIDHIGQILDGLSAETHTGNIGLPTGPPLNAAVYVAIKGILSLALSQKVSLE